MEIVLNSLISSTRYGRRKSFQIHIASRIPTEMNVGFIIGTTTQKNVRSGEQPSIIAASSISREIPFTKPVNMNTASPAPNPRYTKMIPTGFPRCNIFDSLDNVNITIWKGTIMENRQRQYKPFENLSFTRMIYHAHIDVQRIITATEHTVINNDVPNALKKLILRIPSA